MRICLICGASIANETRYDLIERLSNALGRGQQGMGPILASSRRRRRHRRRARSGRSFLLSAAALALAGCCLGNGPGSLFVDPGRYEVYHCNDLVTRWKALTVRERDLRGLIDKASQTGTGAVIGTIAYRSDYESVLTEEKLVQREAAAKKC